MSERAVETHPFQAEVSQVLDLVIHSLYSHREVFLRELVSNASDALDRLKYRALTERDLVPEGHPEEIRISPDPKARTLAIEDFGVGMTHDELCRDLGTVAHSGTKAFLRAVAERRKEGAPPDPNLDDPTLIGQFGVGFYSAYLVADRVEVVSRAAGEDDAWRWASDAKGTFTIEPAERDLPGTTVLLHMKQGEDDLLQTWRLRELVERYSDYVRHPIRLRTEVEEDDGGGEPAYEQINTGGALWQRPKSEITDDEYRAFYRHLTHDFEPPLAWSHFTVEGVRLFTALLYLPARAPFDLFLPDPRQGLRLHVKRVFVMEDCEALLPRWLRFVRGVVDSDDLPLNVSREVLQDSSVTRFIRKQVTKKSLDLVADLAKERPEDYEKLWGEFGMVLKEGLNLSPEHKDDLAPLLRFRSSHGAGLVSLDDYVSRMKEGQKAIYAALGTSAAALATSPHLEALRARGFEVLYLTDPIDEWVLRGLASYRDKPLESAMQADLSLPEEEPPAAKEDEGAAAEAPPPEDGEAADLEPLLTRFREVLGEEVGEVRVSRRLTASPTCLVVPEGGVHAHVERLLRASDRGLGLPRQKRILEVNPTHPIVRALARRHAADPASSEVAEWIELLHDQALLAEGSPLDHPGRLAAHVTRLLEKALGAGTPG